MKIFKEFEGKTAFVTGAASGMGQAAAICFGGLGCRVAVAARNPKALETVQTIRENGGEAIFVECDVTDDDSVRKAIETTVKTFGRWIMHLITPVVGRTAKIFLLRH